MSFRVLTPAYKRYLALLRAWETMQAASKHYELLLKRAPQSAKTRFYKALEKL